jgi:hypothetical protein
MASRFEQKIKEGARPFLEPGEEIQASILARPRGFTQSLAAGSVAGRVAGSLGGRKVANNVAAARDAGFQITSPMALVVSQRRLLAFKIGEVIGFGIGGAVKDLVSAVPVADVDAIQVGGSSSARR